MAYSTGVSPRRARRLPPGMPRRPRGGVPPQRPGAEGGNDEDGAAPRLGPERIEQGPDGQDWVVRPVPGAASVKTYRCPGCDQEIPPGIAHVVTWRAGTADAAGRRHWHTGCWARRLRPSGRRR